MICTTANALWLAGCLLEAARFKQATKRVRYEQHRVLDRLVRSNANTEFGRAHGFSTIRCLRDYQQLVPLRTYDEYQPYIERTCNGSRTVLTREDVRLLEPTSGSASASKLIPYTASLQREFQRGIQAWVADLFVHDPRTMHGRAYWSISPALQRQRRTPGGTPIGFDDDAAYLGGWRSRLVQATMAVHGSVREARDLDAFQHLTLLSLIRCSNLRLISVWNPTFLSLLMDAVEARADALTHDLAADRGRREVFAAALRAQTAAERHAILWPRLRLISCWADANAAAPAARLAQLFPQARVQPKGLIATEGFVSFPLSGGSGSVLAVRSHFFEFLQLGAHDEPREGTPLTADELEPGGRYEVILSTAGGLYRYRLGDVVQVVGHVDQCPSIRFIGRQHYVSDWVGEKLNEAHVAAVLHETSAALGISPTFAMLACESRATPPAYVLYIETDQFDESLNRLGRSIEHRLRDNVHYDYARRLGQLAPVRVFRAENACGAYLNAAVRSGQRAGDVKPVALDRRDGSSLGFQGRFV